jgi:hypothetical protein
MDCSPDETADGIASWEQEPESSVLRFVNPKLVAAQFVLQQVQRNLQMPRRHTLPIFPGLPFPKWQRGLRCRDV